jgi:hypothetical protein
MPISYQFLPWVRRGLTVALTQTETLGNIPARAVAQIGVKLADAHAGTAIKPLSMQLYGPGDVIGIDTALVVRTDPRPGTTNFEPNYLAIIDFDPPDFPWMLTPAKANNDNRLRPWLVLVVLEKTKVGAPKMAGAAPLPQIRVPAAHVAAELPPLGESWSWAHAQVVSKADANDAAAIQADLQSDPRSNISRLICPRRLKPDTDYVACVVPAFEPGRLRGLGLAGDGSSTAMQTLAPAWNHADNKDVVLPVYHHWEFATSVAGDFEYLARKLRSPMKWKNDPEVAELLREIGTMPMSVDDLLNDNTPGLETIMEGALVPIGYKTGTPPDETHEQSLRVIVNTPADRVDNPVVDQPDGSVRRIEVKPPLYGAWHTQTHSVKDVQTEQWWLADLNLTPRYRGAAGYGTEIVRKHQEDYVDACWDQVGRILDAEMKFNLTRLAIEALRHLKAKHFDVLPPERLLQVMGSALPRIEALNAQGVAAYKVNGVTASLGGQVDRSSLPAAMVDGALRRVASPQQRRLRTAAMRTRSLAQLPALNTQYVKAMAGATTKAAAFAVNAFMPDGIAGTAFFDGVNLNAERIDLRGRGLRNPVAATQVRETIGAAAKAREIALGRGVGLPKVRAGMTKGIFTDAHVQRFGALVASTPSVKASDLGLVAAQVEALGRRGVEGFLVEAQIDGGQLQFSAMQIDARSGALRLDQPLLRFSRDRHATRPSRAEVTRAAGMSLGGLPVTDARRFDNISLFANLPANTLDLQSSSTGGVQFELSAGLELTRLGEAPPQRNVASITLPPALRNRTILKRFADATRGTQVLWRDAFVAQRVEVQVVDFPLAASAAIVRARTQPELTLAARLASQVQIAEAAFGKASAHVSSHLLATTAASNLRFAIPALFDRVMAFPHLREPLYRALAGHDPEAFMPGIGNLPPDLIMLVQVNQAFIDSFMVGANFEMNRELLWRGFPTDLRGTPFQRFWDRVHPRTDGTVESLDDMDPIHLWRRQKLGARIDPKITDPDRVALIIKGRLLQRYPNTAVYAWKRLKNVAADKSKLVQPPVVQTPVFAGVIEPDVTFFGFDIDRDDIEDWCFVVEEQMSEPRFGFDVPLPAEGEAGRVGAKPRAALQTARAQWALGNNATTAFKAIKASGFNTWKALSWSDLKVEAGAHVSVGALAALSQAANQPFANFPGLVATPTAAEIAQALLQEPFRAYWEGPDLVMPPPPPP